MIWILRKGFRAHDVNAVVGVDELGDVDVAGDRDESVGVVSGRMRGVERIVRQLYTNLYSRPLV